MATIREMSRGKQKIVACSRGRARSLEAPPVACAKKARRPKIQQAQAEKAGAEQLHPSRHSQETGPKRALSLRESAYASAASPSEEASRCSGKYSLSVVPYPSSVRTDMYPELCAAIP